MKAMFPGSFDPITNGHIDIIERGSVLFEELVVAVMINQQKQSLFPVEERVTMIKEAVKHLGNVTVEASGVLTVDFAREKGASVLIRGIRAVMDYEYELQQATANMMLSHDIESLFLVASPEYSFLSSSTVKTIAMHHGSVDLVVPENVARRLKEKYGENNG